MFGMTYLSESRVLRAVFIFGGTLLIFRFLYFMRVHGTAYHYQLAAPSQPEIPDYLRETLEIEPIPRKIWQTGKNGVASLDEDSRSAIRTWQKLNQNWRYEILTDYSAETYVRNTFSKSRPELSDLYFDIVDPILRADFLRYLVLLGDGGVYSDMDTECLKPIDDWIPANLRSKVSVVIGIEYDKQDGGRWADWTLDLQITNWAMLVRPNHPMMDRTVQLLRERMYDIADRKQTSLRKVQLDEKEVLDTTGPAMLTEAVFAHISDVTQSNFTWENITGLVTSRLIDDILVLPVTGFAPGQGHSGSKDATEEVALVRHLFKGSWKGDRPVDQERLKEEEQQKEKEELEKQKEEAEKARLEAEALKEENEKLKKQEEEAQKEKEELENEKQEAEKARIEAEASQAENEKSKQQHDEPKEQTGQDVGEQAGEGDTQ
jgi:mannosyltransferase OCH1-like enzyme